MAREGGHTGSPSVPGCRFREVDKALDPVRRLLPCGGCNTADRVAHLIEQARTPGGPDHRRIQTLLILSASIFYAAI
jgi:hypothetical protein